MICVLLLNNNELNIELLSNKEIFVSIVIILIEICVLWILNQNFYNRIEIHVKRINMVRKVKLIEKSIYKFGKHDVERLGIFIEMPYMGLTKKDRLDINNAKSARKTGDVIGGMLPGGNKTRCGNMDGYFGAEFTRIFDGEKQKVAKRRRKKDNEPLPFVPAGSTKSHACPGDYFGSFSGTIRAFSPIKRKEPKYKSPKPNPLTSPAKQGGPGYVNITLGEYPQHVPEEYRRVKKFKLKKEQHALVPIHFPQPYFYNNPYMDPLLNPPTQSYYIFKIPRIKGSKKMQGRSKFLPVGPTKWLGGCKGGCFEKWPAWEPSPWLNPKQILDFKPERKHPLVVVDLGPWYPQSMNLKSLFTRSTLTDTDYKVNAVNWKVYAPEYITYLGMENVLL